MSVSELCLIMCLLSETDEHVHTSLRKAILLLCQTGLKFGTELSVDGLLAVTVDKQHVFLISIKETLHANEPCGTNDDAACIYASDSQAVVNFSSACPSTVASMGSDDKSLANGYEEECTSSATGLRLPSETPSKCTGESVTKSDETCRQRHRKQRRTVRRFVDTSCPTTSPTAVSLELLSQPELISDWVRSEGSEAPVHGDGADQQCNHVCKNDMLSDRTDQRDAALATVAETSTDSSEQTFADCANQQSGEAVSNLSFPTEEQEQLQSETSIIAPVPLPSDKESAIDSEHVSKRSHRKRHRTVRRYLAHSAGSVMSSPSMLLTSLSQMDQGHKPGWAADNVSGEASTINEVKNGDEVKNNRCGHACQMNLSSGNSSATELYECRDLSTSLCLSANIKSEIVEPSSTSTDVISQLASLSRNMPPSCDPQHQMALMSQFGLSAVVSAAQQSATGSWQLFPWTPPTLPPVQCGMVCVMSSLVVIIQT